MWNEETGFLNREGGGCIRGGGLRIGKTREGLTKLAENQTHGDVATARMWNRGGKKTRKINQLRKIRSQKSESGEARGLRVEGKK